MPFDVESVGSRFRRIAPAVDFCSLRVVDETAQFLSVRQDVAEPAQTTREFGAIHIALSRRAAAQAGTPSALDIVL